MELWFIYALISVIMSGLVMFFSKVAASRGEDTSIVTVLAFSVLFVGALGVWVFEGASSVGFKDTALVIALSGLLYALLYALRIQSLQYIETTIFFPIYKTISPLIMLGAGVLYFQDQLSSADYLGVTLGALVPLMLIHKSEQSRQNDLVRGLSFLAVCALITGVTFSMAKYVVDNIESVWLFVWFQALFAVVFGVLRIVHTHRGGSYQIAKNVTKDTVYLGLAAGITDLVGVYFLFTALREGLISIVYTINSFYILVPIILAVLIYNEHMNIRKALAIGLSVVAIIFFQI